MDPRKLVVGKAYVTLPVGASSGKNRHYAAGETLYYAAVFDDLIDARCDRCGKLLDGKRAYAFGYDRDPEWKSGGLYLGSECVKKLSMKAEEQQMATMRTLISRLEESTGKIDPLADVYTRQEKVAKISVPVSPGQAASYGSKDAVRKMMRERFPGWTKQQHLAAVATLDKMKQDNEKEWGKIADEAAQATWGRPWQAWDYKVSGIGSDEFAKEFKDRLRANARFGAAISDAKHAHKVASEGNFPKGK